MIRKARKIRGSPELCDLMGGAVGICAGPDPLPLRKRAAARSSVVRIG